MGLLALPDGTTGSSSSMMGAKVARSELRAIPPELRSDLEREMQRTLEDMNAGFGDGIPPGTQAIFVVSDSTGETAKLLASRLLVQFEDVSPIVRIFGYVNSPERLAEVLSKATPQTLVFATLVDHTMVGWLEKLGRNEGVKVVDVMTPMLHQLGGFLESESAGIPGMGVSQQRIDGLVSKEFFGMVEATQFVHETSFGLNRRDWPRADVALVGIAKVGKTGFAVSLAQRGIKAVCVGIDPDKPIPEELKLIKQVIVLSMQDEELMLRRENHIMELMRKNMSLIADSRMVRPERIAEEKRFMAKAAWQHPAWMGPIDCTHKDEAEVASEIIRVLRKADQKVANETEESGFPVLFALVPALAAAAAYVALHAFPPRRAARPLGSGLRGPALAGSSLPAAPRAGVPTSRTSQPAVYPVVRRMGPEQRIEMEMEMVRQVNDEVKNEDPNAAAGRTDKTIYVLSDSTGNTAQMLISRLLVQFRNLKPLVRMRANVRTAEQVETIVDEVKSVGPNTMIFATIVDPSLLKMCKAMSNRMGVKCIDVMSPLLASIGDFFDQQAKGVPGGAIPTKEIVDVEFFNRVEAVQYAQQHLLGLNQKDWKNADVLLIGLSRVGKVSLAFFLAQYGIKAACTDIRPDSKLPQELFDLDPTKVVVVEMQVNMVARRRRMRVEEMRAKSLSMLFDRGYTDLARIQDESDYMNSLLKKNPGWLGPVDLTHLALEERASVLLRVLRGGRQQN